MTDLIIKKLPSSNTDQESGLIPRHTPFVDMNAEFSAAFYRMPLLLPQDFTPIKGLAIGEGLSISIVLCNYGPEITIGVDSKIDWRQQFTTNSPSNVMWLLSLDFVGRLLSSFEAQGAEHLLTLATHCIESFLEFVAVPANRMYVEKIPSGDHSTSTRVRVLVKYFLVTQNIAGIDDALRRRIFEELNLWLQWLAAPSNFHLNNHGLMSSISLLTASQCFGESSALRGGYAELAITRIILLAQTAFDKDGLCYENTIGYHNYNLGLYKIALRFAVTQGIDGLSVDELQSTITLAEEALRYCLRQDNSIPPIGDSPVYMLRITSINASKYFPESGFAVVKNSDLYLSLQCGGRSEIHKQMDDSSITLRYKGIDLLIDAGSYSYDRVAGFGRYVESATGHSGCFPLEFDYLRRNEVLKKFGRIEGGIDHFAQSELGVELGCFYRNKNGNVDVRRKIVVRWPDEILIVDEISTCGDLTESPKVQRFLFGPDVIVQPLGPDTYTLKTADLSGSIFVTGSEKVQMSHGQTEPDIRGWHSVNFGEIKSNQVMELFSNESTAHFAAVFKLVEGATLLDCSPEIRNYFVDGIPW